MEFPQLVMFDLDGTLIDSIPDLVDAVEYALVDMDMPKPGEALARTWVGNGAANLMKRALRFAGLNEPEVEQRLDEALGLFFEHYRRCSTVRTTLYPGTLETLEVLHQRKVTMAIITNKPRQFVAPILEHFGIAQYFVFTLGGDDLPTKKPSPEPLLNCMQELGFTPEQSLMVGDSRNDIQAARAADVAVVAVNYGYNHGDPIENENPDRVIASLTEITDRLKQTG